MFEDGAVGDVAFDDSEWRGVFTPLRDPAAFAQMRLDQQLGTVVWPGDLDLAPESLYMQGRERMVAAPATHARPSHGTMTGAREGGRWGRSS